MQRAGRVLYDLQGAQSTAHRERGVARFVLQHARALQRVAPDLVGGWLLHEGLRPPDGLEPLIATGRVMTAASAGTIPGGVHHIASPYELDIPLDELWPVALRQGMRMVVTLFDVIPEVLAMPYLQDPGLRRRYRARHQLVRKADHVLAISQSAAGDAVRCLGLDPARITVIGAGVSDLFHPTDDRTAAAHRARQHLPGLSERFVFYQGGTDDRKNLAGLLEAWAALPASLRDGRQLVVTCHVTAGDRNHYAIISERLGIAGDLLLTGQVPDDVLVALYQSCELFVFPSIYEGYGLPVAEAQACGAAVIGSGTSSVAELLVEEAQFDPHDIDAMAAALERALTDDGFRDSLRCRARPRPTWDEVARLTVPVYEGLLSQPLRASRRQPVTAIVTPLPPARSEVGRYSAQLAEQLASHTEVDLFVDGMRYTSGPAIVPAGLPVTKATATINAERLRGGYDHVVCVLGNSEFHVQALATLKRRPHTVVLAHDVRLTGLYLHAAADASANADAAPGGFHATLHRMYDGLPVDLGTSGRLTASEAERYGILMAREAIGASDQFLVTSNFAAALARIDARPADTDKVAVVPFALRLPQGWPPDREIARERALVATFGIVNAAKQPQLLLDAFALVVASVPGARLAIVGAAAASEIDALHAQARRLGIEDAVTITGEIEPASYAEWIGRTTVAVQLRAWTNGEASAALGDCLTTATPTVATAIGWARELPDDAVLKIEVDVSAEQLADTLCALIRDDSRRQQLADAARRVSAEMTMERAADALWDALSG